ncbi:MAG: tRNA epoxyqueuosine(34) reductase QueG, partial [Terriglobales bacterium]
LLAPLLAELGALDEEAYRLRFRNSAAKRAKFSGLQRNLAIAMGNSGNPAFLDRLQSWTAAAGDLAEHAHWAIAKIHHAQTCLRPAVPADADHS